MKKQVFNPCLPSYEYIPDGEPRVFDGRLYIYGSHDRFNGDVYCANDYVCWSAPENDLSDWRYEGVIYRKTQDPRNPDGTHALWAPDGVIEQRLRARPKERGFTSDEAIRPHIEYNQWIGRNRGKYQLFINNEAQSEEETAKIIMEYIKALPATETTC